MADLNGDILVELFLILAQLDKPTPTSLGWISLTHVCRLWRSVGLDLAPLWADTFCSFASASACAVMRERARDVPHVVSLPRPLSRRHEDVLVHVVSSHIRAIHTLSLTSNSYSWVSLLHGKSLPSLHHLSLSGSSVRDPYIYKYPKLGPPLIATSLETAYLKADRPLRLVAPALRTLSFVRQEVDVPSMLEMLKECPSLEELTIKSSVKLQSSVSREPSTVSLPCLRTLTFRNLLPSVQDAIRSQIATPQDVKVIADDGSEGNYIMMGPFLHYDFL